MLQFKRKRLHFKCLHDVQILINIQRCWIYNCHNKWNKKNEMIKIYEILFTKTNTNLLWCSSDYCSWSMKIQCFISTKFAKYYTFSISILSVKIVNVILEQLWYFKKIVHSINNQTVQYIWTIHRKIITKKDK